MTPFKTPRFEGPQDTHWCLSPPVSEYLSVFSVYFVNQTVSDTNHYIFVFPIFSFSFSISTCF